MSVNYPCYLVRETPEGPRGGVTTIADSELPNGDVVVEVAYSSLNYKDALAARGHKGIAPKLPHIPGIDCAGVVAASTDDSIVPGQEVLITGYDLGGVHWGGYCARVRVPADWVVPMPKGLTAREAMIYGTAGFTAAQCVMAIEQRVAPGAGDVLVTGATGGVAVFAIAILAKLGYRVVASTGKSDQAEALRAVGAAEVVGRDAVRDDSSRPMVSAKWAAAVDTVGGGTLTDAIRATGYRGVVAACGLVGGDQLPLTVYPFLLRGVTLAGIDSAKCPAEPRREIWRRLAGPWRVDLPESLVTTVNLDGLNDRIEQILAGGVAGRTLVRPISEAEACVSDR